MNLNKPELAQQLKEKHGCTKKAALEMIDMVSDIIVENLRCGNTVSIHDFGCFDILERAERSTVNPATGKTMTVPAHYIPRFYPGKGMRVAVKLWEDDEKRGLI